MTIHFNNIILIYISVLNDGLDNMLIEAVEKEEKNQKALLKRNEEMKKERLKR